MLEIALPAHDFSKLRSIVFGLICLLILEGSEVCKFGGWVGFGGRLFSSWSRALTQVPRAKALAPHVLNALALKR